MFRNAVSIFCLRVAISVTALSLIGIAPPAQAGDIVPNMDGLFTLLLWEAGIVSLVVGIFLGCVFGQIAKLVRFGLLLNLVIGVAGAGIGVVSFWIADVWLEKSTGIQLSYAALAIVGATLAISLTLMSRRIVN